MLSIKRELDKAIRALRRSARDVLFTGQLVKITRTPDPATNTVAEVTSSVDVDIIADVIDQDEVNGTTFLITDFKLHIIAKQGIDVSYYDMIRSNNESFQAKDLRIISKKAFVEGSKNLMFTVISR
jgi:hypothetical protein